MLCNSIVLLVCLSPVNAVCIIARSDFCLASGCLYGSCLFIYKAFNLCFVLCKSSSVIFFLVTSGRDRNRGFFYGKRSINLRYFREVCCLIVSVFILDHISIIDYISTYSSISLASTCCCLYCETFRQAFCCYFLFSCSVCCQRFSVIGLFVTRCSQFHFSSICRHFQGSKLLCNSIVLLVCLSPVNAVCIIARSDFCLASGCLYGSCLFIYKAFNLCFVLCKSSSVIFFLVTSGRDRNRGFFYGKRSINLRYYREVCCLIVSVFILDHISVVDFILAYTSICLASACGCFYCETFRQAFCRYFLFSCSVCCQRFSIIGLFVARCSQSNFVSISFYFQSSEFVCNNIVITVCIAPVYAVCVFAFSDFSLCSSRSHCRCLIVHKTCDCCSVCLSKRFTIVKLLGSQSCNFHFDR